VATLQDGGLSRQQDCVQLKSKMQITENGVFLTYSRSVRLKMLLNFLFEARISKFCADQSTVV